MNFLKPFAYLSTVFICQNLYALDQVQVNVVFATNSLEAQQFDHLKQIQKEIMILNQFFVSESNDKIFEFKLNQYMPYAAFKERNCKLHEVLNQNQPINVSEVKSAFNTCFTEKNKQIYMYML